MPIFDIIRSDHYRSEAEIQVEGHDSLVSYSAKAVIDDIVNERQQHFELPPFVHFWRKSWTDESERPLIENRYSPFRPETEVQEGAASVSCSASCGRWRRLS